MTQLAESVAATAVGLVLSKLRASAQIPARHKFQLSAAPRYVATNGRKGAGVCVLPRTRR